MFIPKSSFLLLLSLAFAVASPVLAAAESRPPRAGQSAPDFTLQTLDDRPIELRPLATQRTVVLVVLRGWPGYQCPICTRQVNEYVGHAADFAARNAQVIMVYPGPAEQLKAHADEFLHNQQWPADFLLVLDPGYVFTDAYGLRWNAKNETAYPSTFIVDRDGQIRFAHVSRSHGNRAPVTAVLAALAKPE